MNIYLKTLITAFVALCINSSVLADNHGDQSKINFTSSAVGDGLYMISGVGGFAGGNIALLTGKDGVVMIDDSMPPLLPKLELAIQKLTNSAPNFLLNTHFHGDHTGNNAAFAKKDTHIIAHHHVRKRLAEEQRKESNGVKKADPASLPVITIPGDTKLHLNKQTIDVIHLPNAHTDGDLAIRFVEANVIHTGDVFFNGLFPFIDIDHGGDAKNYLNAQKKLLKLMDGSTKIIPGHGPMATRSDLERAAAMLEDSINLVQAMLKKGKSEADILAADPLKKYHKDWNWGFITTEKMTKQLVKSLRK